MLNIDKLSVICSREEARIEILPIEAVWMVVTAVHHWSVLTVAVKQWAEI